jgi:hypothetical protein
MHTYEFTFKCERCTKELKALVTSPDVLAREQLNETEFQFTCLNPDCGWSGTRTEAQAEKIRAALKTDVSLCDRADWRTQVTWATVLVRWGPVEGKAVSQDWALVRRDRAVLPAATPVAVAAEEWWGRASEGPVVLNSGRR